VEKGDYEDTNPYSEHFWKKLASAATAGSRFPNSYDETQAHMNFV